MLVIGRDGRIVVACDPRDLPLTKKGDDFIRPRRVPGEITEVVGRIDVPAASDVGEDRLQRGKIRVNVGYECIPHQARAFLVEVTRRVMTTAVSGHAPWNSADALTAAGTADRTVGLKPNRGK